MDREEFDVYIRYPEQIVSKTHGVISETSKKQHIKFPMLCIACMKSVHSYIEICKGSFFNILGYAKSYLSIEVPVCKDHYFANESEIPEIPKPPESSKPSKHKNGHGAFNLIPITLISALVIFVVSLFFYMFERANAASLSKITPWKKWVTWSSLSVLLVGIISILLFYIFIWIRNIQWRKSKNGKLAMKEYYIKINEISRLNEELKSSFKISEPVTRNAILLKFKNKKFGEEFKKLNKDIVVDYSSNKIE